MSAHGKNPSSPASIITLRRPPFSLSQKVEDFVSPPPAEQELKWERIIDDVLAKEIQNANSGTRTPITEAAEMYFADRRASLDTKNKEDKILNLIPELDESARKGDSSAAMSVARLAIMLTGVNTELGEIHSATLAYMARFYISWPVMKSPHPKLCEENPKIIESVGKGLPVSITKYSRFDIHDTYGAVAWKLWCYVSFWRDEAQMAAQGKMSALESKKAMEGKRVAGYGSKPSPKLTTDEMLVLLPSLRPEPEATNANDAQGKANKPLKQKVDSRAVEAWWTVAKRVLIESYHLPETPDQLNEQEPALNALVTSKGHRRNPGAIRDRIFVNLENKFYRFAGLTDL